MQINILKKDFLFNLARCGNAMTRMASTIFSNMVKQDTGLLIALFIVVLIWALHANTIPWLDSASEIVMKQLHFYEGDFEGYKAKVTMDHPLGRIVVLTVFLKIFGLYGFATTLPGMLLNVAAVISIFFLCKRFFNLNCARIAAILLACDPVFMASSIHTLPDHFYAAVALIACYAFAENKMKLWALALVAAVLTKETALLLVFAFIAQWAISLPFFLREHKKIEYAKLLIPVATLAIYVGYLKVAAYYGIAPWTFAGKSGFDTVIENLNGFVGLKRMISGNFFERFNWLNLTVFNFQWLINALAYWWFCIWFWRSVKVEKSTVSARASYIACAVIMLILAALLCYIVYFLLAWQQYIISISVFVILPFAYFTSIFIVNKASKLKATDFVSPFWAVMFFIPVHICLVLTYNTWSIPRYVLPITVFIIIPAALFIDFLAARIGKNARYFLYGAGLLIMAIRFFTTSDPITQNFMIDGHLAYTPKLVHGQVVYRDYLNNLDAAVYNGQYMSMLSKRTAWYHELVDLDLDRLGYTQLIDCNDMTADAYKMLIYFVGFDPAKDGLCTNK